MGFVIEIAQKPAQISFKFKQQICKGGNSLYFCKNIFPPEVTMPRKTPPETETLVLAFSKEGMTPGQVKKRLAKLGISIGESTIRDIVNKKGKTRQLLTSGVKNPKFTRKRRIRHSRVIAKVKAWTSLENPPSQTEMAKRLKVSRRTVQKIITEDLNLRPRKKPKVHKLLPRHIKNRKSTSRKLYEKYLSGQRSEFTVTLDEAYFYLEDCNHKSKICYVRVGEETPLNWVIEKRESFEKKFMVVGAMTGRGVIPLFRVPNNVKVSGEYYVEKVLKPLIEVHLPPLYGDEMSKVVIHHDQASSHMSKVTTAYAQVIKGQLGVTILAKSDIPVKSPDASPLDFFGFGHLKQRLGRRRARSLGGVWKILQEEWNLVTPIKCRNIYAEWKRRLRLIHKMHGLHIEHTQKIHKRKLT